MIDYLLLLCMTLLAVGFILVPLAYLLRPRKRKQHPHL